MRALTTTTMKGKTQSQSTTINLRRMRALVFILSFLEALSFSSCYSTSGERMAQTVLLSTGTRFHHLPESYIRPTSERPNLSEVVSKDFPVIDLGCQDKELVIRQIADACQSHGFFQVINHGISVESMQKMMAVSREFFHLPIEEKMRFYSDDPSKKMRLSTSFNVTKEKVHNWRDYLRLHCHPLEDFVHEWPSTPSSFK